ncbi:MAG TPA: ATP-binding protein [Burkholderiaceae bacterium]|nr:ATP-binding protein [Burkholderiaceae bacterium]
MSAGAATAGNVDLLPGGWLILAGDARIRACNAWVRRISGRTEQDLIGQPFERLLAPASAVLFQSYVFALLRLHGSVQEFELVLRDPAGQDLPAMLYAGPSPEGSQVLLLPLRQRQRAQAELLRVKRAADSAPGMIFELVRQPDGHMYFAYVSESVRTLFGVSAEAAAQSADLVFHHVHPDDLPRLMRGFRESARRQQPRSESFRVQMPDGRLRWHEVMVRPHARADGSTLWHGHVSDVSLRQELAAARVQQQTAEEAARARSELMARISHELRTPLNAILGFTQLMLGDQGDTLKPDQLERLQTIYTAGRTLLNLVNEVLDTTGLETGQVDIQCEPVPLAWLLQHALALIQLQASTAGITLEPAACPPFIQVQANAQRLGQVLGNLLSNAIKYNRPGGRVRMAVHVDPSAVRIEVHDTGPGLSEAQLAGLFQPFNRLGAERTATPGTGLGLVITRQLVQRMKGEIEVHSRVGEGSCFAVSLRRAPDRVQDPASSALGPAALPARTPGGAAGPALRTVMYVEDNTVNIVLMEAILAHRPGVRVVTARDGAEALARAREQAPDLFLLDLHLPDMDGFELLRRLRAQPALARIPAAVVSAAATPAEMSRARAEGFEAYWTKPLDVAHTLSELDRLLGGPAAISVAENESKISG